MLFLNMEHSGSCMYGRAVSLALGKNCMLEIFCTYCCLCCNRGAIKTKYNITGGGCMADYCCCNYWSPCAMLQIVDEVNSREGVKIGAFGDPNGTWACTVDCLSGPEAQNQFKGGASSEMSR